MKHKLANFTLSREDFSFTGQGLSRPECVWVDTTGVWVSDNRGGVALVHDSENPSLLGSGIGEPNGFSRRRNGAFVVAGLTDGKLHEISPEGHTKVLVGGIDGKPLGTVNHAWVDGQDRVWVSIMTRRSRWYERLSSAEPDGYILLIDEKGPRIVADGLNLTNEVKLSPDGTYLYVAESLGRRIVRFPVKPSGELGPLEVFGPSNFGYGGFPDGFAFDSEGNIWVTLINRNGISIITHEGELLTVYEEVNAPALETLVTGVARLTGTPEEMGKTTGEFLRLPTSLAFGGPDLCTVYVGSLLMSSLPTFRSPLPGIKYQ